MKPKHGRGTTLNPSSRFSEQRRGPVEVENLSPDDENPGPRTQFFPDASRSILTENKSPDVGFDTSVNPYRGCEHGCVYCYARPTHEYLGLSAGEDFETKIFYKADAAPLLRARLSSRAWQPRPISFSGITDPYQPAERRFRLTRACLEVCADFGNPVQIITKNHLVTRDLDLLTPLARDQAAVVVLSLTTLDPELCATLEPRTSRPNYRLEAIRKLSEAGIPVGVNLAPLIPGLTDEEIPALLKAAYDAGARFAGYTMLRLPYGVKDLFEDWVRRARPERAEKILARLREIRAGKLNDARFGSRMRGEGVFAEQIGELFRLSRRKVGLDGSFPELSTSAFRRPESQLKLF